MPLTAATIASRLAALTLATHAACPAAAAPYTRSFGDHIAAIYPAFPFTRHTTRLVEIAQRVADGELPRLLQMQARGLGAAPQEGEA